MTASFSIAQLDNPADPDIREMLISLAGVEQERYDHPRRTRTDIERDTAPIADHFVGDNVLFVARQEDGHGIGLAWCVLFDPGTGLEGELAELFVVPEWQGKGVARALCARAVQLFRERQVTFACVWTRDDNPAALAAYRAAGFRSTEQAVLTWLPLDKE